MSDQFVFDPSTVKLPSAITKHNGYYDSEKAHERYEENRLERQAMYSVEKVLGRRRQSGAMNLQKLKPRHLRMIAMFVEGIPSTEIAAILDVSHTCVLETLKDPLAGKYIEDFAEGHKADFNAMFPLVNGAIQEGLRHVSTDTKLKAVDRWHKLHKTINGGEEGETAQTKTKEIIATRFRFIDQIRELAEKSGVIEGEVVTITETVE